MDGDSGYRLNGAGKAKILAEALLCVFLGSRSCPGR